MVKEQTNSILCAIGSAICFVFSPLGFGNWKATVATITGLIAKENVVSTFAILYNFAGEVSENGEEIWSMVAQDYTQLSAYSFMIFNLLCAPCFAAMGAIKREMNNAKWTWFAILYQCGFAYAIAFMITQFGWLFTGIPNVVGLIFAFAVLALIIYMLFFKKYKEANKLTVSSVQ